MDQSADLKSGLPILGFASASEWETWLSQQAATSQGVWLKLAKKGATTASVSRQDAIEGALCHGWIDGQLGRFDDEFWLVRFTPRKRNSKWSEVNRTTAAALIERGRMHPAGLGAVEAAKADGRWEAAYAPQSTAAIPADLQAALDASAEAARFFMVLDRANRYAILYRIQDARTPEARARRIERFIAMLERGEMIHPR
ncbi:YdeI/OmpD-associated family protein [Methylobacterium nigriterrae]|uniref:YdeI/OmpD-associated family protein n=1 Tax=Methylobacterium nigriterrae TaxID=3127512 RepID=UPI0030138100